MNNQQGQQPQWLPSYGQPNQQSQSLPPQQQWQQTMPPQQEWQWQPPVYPPPQYQQPLQYQPQTPPPQMPPQKPKSRKRLWLIIGAVVVVLIVIGAIASQAGNSSQPATTSQATQPASTGQQQQPTTQPTQATTQTPTVGKPYVVNNTWTVTVNSVKTSHGTEFDTPKAGNIYLVVNVTLKNTSSQVQNTSSLAMFSLKDTTGQSYEEDIAYGTDPGSGHVEPNGLARGDIAYEVPASAHSFILQFVPDFGSSDLVEWNLTI